MAEVDGVVITRADIYRSAGKELQSLHEKLYHLEKKKLDEYIDAALLTREARKRSISVSSLLEQETKLKIAPVSENDVQMFYEKNKNRIGAELDKVNDQIRDYLLEQRNAQQKSEFLKTLRAKAKDLNIFETRRGFQGGSGNYWSTISRIRHCAYCHRQVRGFSVSILQNGTAHFLGYSKTL